MKIKKKIKKRFMSKPRKITNLMERSLKRNNLLKKNKRKLIRLWKPWDLELEMILEIKIRFKMNFKLFKK
jgi:hypothetical protein